jgi:lipopolysaccharide heptosyltransferase I
MSLREHPQRILVVRLSAIGDAIVTLPMLCALRDCYPEAFIAWVAEPGPAKIIAGHSALDELIVVRKGWMKSPLQIMRLRSKLRSLNFDLTIDPQGLTKSAAAAWLSGAKRRIGFSPPAGRELSPRLNNELLLPETTHIVDRQVGLLEALGIVDPGIEFRIPDDAQATRTVDALIESCDLQLPFVVVNPGAGWFSRTWPPVRYGLVARHLGLQYGIRSIVVWSGEQERRRAEEIEQFAEGQATLAPATTLPELAALLRRAAMYLGSDTGPMHLAAAVGTRCLALFGTTRPQDSGPYGERHVRIQSFYQAGSSRERRQASNEAMRAITVEEVTQACEQVLLREALKAA